MLLKSILLTLLIIFLTACAGNSGKIAKYKTNNDGDICRYEKSTGTHIRTKICRTPAQIEKERKDARQIFNRAISGANTRTEEPKF